MGWTVAEAKQRLSEVLRSAEKEPQKIYNRSRLVALIVAPEAFEAFAAWRERQSRRSVADAFEELRRLTAREGYTLRLPDRRNRRNAFASSLR